MSLQCISIQYRIEDREHIRHEAFGSPVDEFDFSGDKINGFYLVCHDKPGENA